MEKPGLALLIGHALAKNGKAKHDPMPQQDGADGAEQDSHMAHLKEIAADILQAVDDKDADGLAELLQEAFEVCDSSPHQEEE